LSRNWQDIPVAADWQLREELTGRKRFQIADSGLPIEPQPEANGAFNLTSQTFDLQSIKILACSAWL
jgi:hypothetical protein